MDLSRTLSIGTSLRSKPLESVEALQSVPCSALLRCALVGVAPPGLHDFISLTQASRPGLTHFAPPALVDGFIPNVVDWNLAPLQNCWTVWKPCNQSRAARCCDAL